MLTNQEGLVVEELSSPLAGPFSFDVPRGSCLTITGPSGSGKSLLLRLIADLDPGLGTVRLGGLDRSKLTGPDWRRQCAYVAAVPGFWLVSAADHFEPSISSEDLATADAMLIERSRLIAPVEQLSTGERQRVAILRALALQPSVMLLDEPTGPLDRNATSAVTAVLADRMKKGTTLVIVTHDQELPTRLGARQSEMRNRKLVPL